jgi:hypothetical protein
MRNDPDIIPTSETNTAAMAPRKSSYQYALDRCLGSPWASAQFLHTDTFEPAPRPHGPPTSGPPSPGIRNKLAMDAAFRKEHPELQALVDKEDRDDYFWRIRLMLGKRIPGQQPQPKRPQAQPQTVVDAGGGDDRESYFARLKSQLGRKL